MKYKMSPGRRIFVVGFYAFCISVGVGCILPVVLLLAVSLSSQNAVFSGHVAFWPVEFTLDAYRYMMQDGQFFVSYLATIERTVLGWAISMTLLILAAYPLSLSKHRFPARTFFVWYFMGIILFNGGMIPTYLVVSKLGLLDTIWSLVLVDAVPVYNLILMVNFMKSIPDSLKEAAYIDGAGHLTTLLRIVLPLSKASLATVSLFVILQHWNAWFDGVIYIRNMALKPLQSYLRTILLVDTSLMENSDIDSIMANLTRDATNGAKIFLTLLPVMCVYPFLQKHFVKGIVQGSLKE